MNTPVEIQRSYPLQFSLRGRTIVVCPFDAPLREAMLQFARNLPDNDLLFLDRDITQPPVVDHWIREVASGNLVTIVASHGEAIVGYATIDRGTASWTRHVVELRVVVAESLRGIGVGRLLLELVFEKALQLGITKLVARMTPDQSGARKLFQGLGFAQEAVLRDNALDAHGITHDLLVFCYHTRQHQEDRCGGCGVPVLTALSLEGVPLCPNCYELRYDELGAGD
jgi:L-amino acid N-acyltransferase YncA